MKKIKKRLIKKNKQFKLPLIIPIFLVVVTLAGLLWYKNNAVTPSINLADGLDAEEAAFLQKSIAKDKGTSVGTAPAPVVKVTVKKKNGDEVTGKVVLRNVDPASDVTTLTKSITNTVTTNNSPTISIPSASPQASAGLSCNTIGDGQWAQTGTRYQADGTTPCTTSAQCGDKKECVKCVNGSLDLSSKEVCGTGLAINYITTTADKDMSASCWNNGLWYSSSSSLANIGYCQNGKWEPNPPSQVVKPVVIDTRIEQEEIDKQKQLEIAKKMEQEAEKNASRIKTPYSKQGCDNAKKADEKCIVSADNPLLYMIVSLDYDKKVNSGVSLGTPTSEVKSSPSPSPSSSTSQTTPRTSSSPNNTSISYEFGSVSVNNPPSNDDIAAEDVNSSIVNSAFNQMESCTIGTYNSYNACVGEYYHGEILTSTDSINPSFGTTPRDPDDLYWCTDLVFDSAEDAGLEFGYKIPGATNLYGDFVKNKAITFTENANLSSNSPTIEPGMVAFVQKPTTNNDNYAVAHVALVTEISVVQGTTYVTIVQSNAGTIEETYVLDEKGRLSTVVNGTTYYIRGFGDLEIYADSTL